MDDDALAALDQASNVLVVISTIYLVCTIIYKCGGGEEFLNGLNDPSVQKYDHDPPRVNLTKILLPFRVKLIGIKEAYRIEIELSAVSQGTMKVFWGVNINAFHQVLRAPDKWFAKAFFHGNLFGKGKCMESGRVTRVGDEKKVNLILEKPTSKPLKLGSAPRDIYPCVVVIANKSSSLLSVIHVRDDLCTVPSQILAEYHKSGSTATLLQPIYLANSDISENSDTESQTDSDTEELEDGKPAPRCVICQQEKTSRVILPCRHAASCHKCFSRLEHCPMCRGFIQSYFLLRKEPDKDRIRCCKHNKEVERRRRLNIERLQERWGDGEDWPDDWLEQIREALREDMEEERREERQEDNDDMFGNPLRYVWLRIPSTAGGWLDLLHSFWMFLFTTRDFQ